MDESCDRLHWHCTACESLCEHIGAAFSLILDEKMTLGLAAPPPERVPVESLSEEELIERAIEERRERTRAERMTVNSAHPEQPWTDYTATSTISGKTYGVAVRGRPLSTTLKQHLTGLVEQDQRGRPQLTFALPDATALDSMATVLARLLARTPSA